MTTKSTTAAQLSIAGGQLRDQPLSAVDVAQRLGDGRSGDGDGAVYAVLKAEGATETRDVEVEDGADHLSLRIDGRRARVAPDDVVVTDEVEHGMGIHFAVRILPATPQKKQ